MHQRTRFQLSLDPWTAGSLLQKAIRRGDVCAAQAAAFEYARFRGTGLWRSLILIAFEDVGIGDLDLVAEVASLDVRLNPANEPHLVNGVVRRMALAPKSREVDYAIAAADFHPSYRQARDAAARNAREHNIDISLNPDHDPVFRTIAALAASYAGRSRDPSPSRDGVARLAAALATAGGHAEFAHLALSGTTRMRSPMMVVLPVLALAASQAGSLQLLKEPCANSQRCLGIPLYTFDKHTHLGKRAVGVLVRENRAVREHLLRYVPEFRARDVAAMAAYYVDAIPVALHARWNWSTELERLGMEADMAKVGCPVQAAAPIVECVRANLDHLNAIRRRLLVARKAGAPTPSVGSKA